MHCQQGGSPLVHPGVNSSSSSWQVCSDGKSCIDVSKWLSIDFDCFFQFVILRSWLVGCQEFQSKNIITFPHALHTCGICMLGAPTSIWCTLCDGWECIQYPNSSHKLCLYSSTGDVTSGHCSIALAWLCSLCVAQFRFLLQTVSWFFLAVDPLTALSLIGQCCTRRLELLVSLFHASQRS